MAKKVELSSDKQKNKTVSAELLESVRSALYKLKDYLNKIDFKDAGDFNEELRRASSIIAITEKLGKSIETLAILEKKVQAEELVNQKVRGGAKLSLLEEDSI